jgi:hypothetical protein
MVSDAVECLETKIEWFENDIGAPNGVVVTAGYECIEGIFAGMPARTMPTVVAKSDCLGERNVEPKGTRDRCSHLCDLESVRKASALVVVGKDEDLGLSGKTTKGGRMKDPVAVSLETGAVVVGRFGNRTVATTDRLGCAFGQKIRRA